MKQFLLIILASVGTVVLAAPSPLPSPKWQPVQVVSIQLEAMRNNDPANDQGIATAYQFASPRNKAAVGGLKDFNRLLHGGYSDMLQHTAAELETVKIENGEAVIGVTLTVPGAKRHQYFFVLEQNQGDPCDGCWLTDGVIPLDAQAPPPLQSI